MVEIIELYPCRRKISQEMFPGRMITEFAPHAKNDLLIKGLNGREASALAMAAHGGDAKA